MDVWLAGWPKTLGGANTEAWHTLKLWISHGVRVHVIPTWTASEPTRGRLERLGCQVHKSSPDTLEAVPGLPGSTVVGFCNIELLKHATAFRDLDCRIIWVGCMCWPFPVERLHYQAEGTFEAHVFQSKHQRDHLIPHLRHARFGGLPDDRICQIRGAFDWPSWELTPLEHRLGERFVIGRLSRASLDKYPEDLWEQYARVPHPTSVRVMGWSDEVEAKCGSPPEWAEVLPENAETTKEFLGKIHALVPGMDCCVENWPRVGLEAMASGVPIIAEDKGGWTEMLGNGAGLLGNSADEQAFYVAMLAYAPQTRMDLILAARSELESELAPPDVLWDKWATLFERLACPTRSTN